MTWTKSHRQRAAISRAVKHRKAMVMEVERLIGEGATKSIALIKSIQSKHRLSLHEAFQIVADADRRAAAKGEGGTMKYRIVMAAPDSSLSLFRVQNYVGSRWTGRRVFVKRSAARQWIKRQRARKGAR